MAGFTVIQKPSIPMAKKKNTFFQMESASKMEEEASVRWHPSREKASSWGDAAGENRKGCGWRMGEKKCRRRPREEPGLSQCRRLGGVGGGRGWTHHEINRTTMKYVDPVQLAQHYSVH